MPLDAFTTDLIGRLRLAGIAPVWRNTIDQARLAYSASRGFLGDGPVLAEVRDLDFASADARIACRLYLPGADVGGMVVYLHGGGWALGDIDDYDPLARALAARSGCAVLLPEYRLAPENPFPAAMHDAENAVRFAAAGVSGSFRHPPAIMVAGDSAGANLATVVARRLRGEIAIAAQALVYPATDGAMDSASYVEFGEGLPLTARSMSWFLDSYAPGDLRFDHDVSPLRATDLLGMPPTYLCTAEFDVLRDEGEAYAAKLVEAGNTVTARRYLGVTHGFFRYHNRHDVARRAVDEVAAFLRARASQAAGA